MRHFLVTIFSVIAVHAGNADEHWNQFRGPRGNGVSTGNALPVEFDESKNVRWKASIPESGWSSPVVWGNQIWLTTAREDGKELFAICVDLESGKVVHDIKVFDVANPQKLWEGLNTHATPTPVIEEGRVYVHFGAYGTACLDTTTGMKLWERRDFRCNHYVRPASSPVIDGDTLLLTFDGVDVQYTVSHPRMQDAAENEPASVVTQMACPLSASRKQPITQRGV